MIDGILFALILGTIVLGIVAQFVEVDREITAEETEKRVKAKYIKELHDWQQTAMHPTVEITSMHPTIEKTANGEKVTPYNKVFTITKEG